MDFSIILRDEGHLQAHLSDFLVDLELALGWAQEQLGRSPRRSGWEHFSFKTPKPVGLSGLAPVHAWTKGDFWAPRLGRTIPSHLIQGPKKPTRDLCIWGFWQTSETFVLHTLYPGLAAPREIHDPELLPAELPASLKFWTTHAIVVSQGEWKP